MIRLDRRTRETSVSVTLDFGSGISEIATGEPFLDHMLSTLSRYSGLDLTLKATGDLRHHLIEDCAITLGAACHKLLPESAARFGDVTVPMDEALVHAALDLGGRHFYRGPVPSALYDHWMRSWSEQCRATLHLRVIRGTDRHHIIEAAFKALGLALRQALRQRGDTVFSTKGTVDWDSAC